jgi:ankyrin repeat protein
MNPFDNLNLEEVIVRETMGFDSTHHLIALNQMVHRNDIESIRDYLESNPNINFKNNSCLMRPLHTALTNGKLEIVDLLLEHGANIDDPSARSDSSSGLFNAVSNNNLDLMKFCIERGANINMINGYGRTPLMEACFSKNNFNIIKFLLDNGANINLANRDGENVLTYAVLSLDIKLVNFLLFSGANFPSDEFIRLIVQVYGKRYTNMQRYLTQYKLIESLYIINESLGIYLDADNIEMLQEFIQIDLA